MMISHGVEISIAGDGADEKDGRKQGASSAKTDPASDPSALRPDASDVFSASPASCAS